MPKFTKEFQGQVLAKTNERCWYCGCVLRSLWNIEHQVPRARGGTDDLDNLVPACKDCNGTKSSKTVEELREKVLKDEAMHIQSLIYGLDKLDAKSETYRLDILDQIISCREAVGELQRALE